MGKQVWVRVEGGNKLGKRVQEGRWMGLDEQSKGVQIYWPDKRNVGVERNVYVDKTGASASRLEGEEWDGFVETNTDTPSIPKIPPISITLIHQLTQPLWTHKMTKIHQKSTKRHLNPMNVLNAVGNPWKESET